eukprot:gene6885-6560_t
MPKSVAQSGQKLRTRKRDKLKEKFYTLTGHNQGGEHADDTTSSGKDDLRVMHAMPPAAPPSPPDKEKAAMASQIVSLRHELELQRGITQAYKSPPGQLRPQWPADALPPPPPP